MHKRFLPVVAVLSLVIFAEAAVYMWIQEPMSKFVKSSRSSQTAAVAISSTIIPPDRLFDWTPGVTVGVPGGIPNDRTNIIDVTAAPYFADNTGVNDTGSIITQAVLDAPANSVVYLPEGTYKFEASNLYAYGNWRKGNVTLRGAGMDKTIIDCRTGSSCLFIGTGSDWNWSWPPSGNTVTAGATKGSTQITIGDTSQFSVGQLLLITGSGDKYLPVVSVGGFFKIQKQFVKITGKSGNTLSFYPPLAMDLSMGDTHVNVAQQQIEYFGVEDLTVDTLGGAGFKYGIWAEQTLGFWMKNVKVQHSSNYNVFVMDSLGCEIRHSYLGPLFKTETPNGAGLLMNIVSGCLVEDNIITDSFPNIELNHGSSGNVFSYNFFNNKSGLIGIDSNHGPHNSFNLYEGNVGHNFMSDGYFGSASHDTVYRNWFSGLGLPSTQTYCLSLKRFTRNYSLVGNMLGNSGNPVGCEGYGQPNIGNGYWLGEVQPSKGIWWADWNPVDGPSIKGTVDSIYDVNGWNGICEKCGATITLTSGKLNDGAAPSFTTSDGGGFMGLVGILGDNKYSIDRSPWSQKIEVPIGISFVAWPGAGGFQEMDLDVEATTLFKANWRASTNSIASSEAISSSLPASLYLPSKPGFFGTLQWPAVDPYNPRQDISIIPAGYRYKYGTEAPGVTEGNPPPPPAATSYTLTVSKSGTGTGTISGSGISCGSTCSVTLPAGSIVTLSASPSSGSTFSGWGGACSGTGSCSLTLSSNSYISAAFSLSSVPPTPDTTLPTVSITAPASGATVSGSSVSISATAGDNVGVVGVQFRLDGAPLGQEDLSSPYSTTWNTTSSTNGSHSISAIARDAAGNTRTHTVSVTVSNVAVPDTTAPSIPSGLSASSITQTGLTLSWNASTDNVGVVSYRVYRNGTLIATPLSNSYVVSGLSSNTSYFFSVSAQDAAGNSSAQSGAISVKTSSVPVATYSLTVLKNGSGRVSGPGISCGSQCTASITSGTTVYLNATPSNDKKFLGWSGACSGTGNCVISMNANKTVTANFDTGQSAPVTTTVTGSTLSLSRDLSVGSTGQDVLSLQKYLNSKGFAISSSGPGSAGNETDTFGSLTRLAVIRFQTANGISGTGYVGPQTRARMAGGIVPPTSTVSPSTSYPSSTYTAPKTTSSSNLYLKAATSIVSTLESGSTGSEVVLLQKMLSNMPGIYPEKLVNGRFNDATELAVMRFQQRYSIAAPGDIGYGVVGPKTRAKLNELWNGN